MPVNSRILPSVTTAGESVGYRSYTPANERTSRPTPNCHRSKGPPRELLPCQSYSAGSIIISICGVIFSAHLALIKYWEYLILLGGGRFHIRGRGLYTLGPESPDSRAVPGDSALRISNAMAMGSVFSSWLSLV